MEDKIKKIIVDIYLKGREDAIHNEDYPDPQSFEAIEALSQLFYTKMEEVLPFECPIHMSACKCSDAIEKEQRKKLLEMLRK